MTRRPTASVVVLGALAFGCANDKGRPPPPLCPGCSLSPNLGAGQQMPDGGTQGEAGSDAGTSQGIELTGSVLVLNDDLNFSTGDFFTDSANIQTDGADGKPVTASWDGITPFAVENVKQAKPVWVLVTPPNGVADDAVPAFEPVVTDKPDANNQVSANLALLHASTVEHIFDLASVPLTTDTSKAQVVLLLETSPAGATTPSPQAGVTVQSSSAENVIYAASGGFSDVAMASDNTGVVVLGNVAAAAWPGAVINVVFTGARTGGSQVRVVSGAVTIATIVQ